MIVVVLVAVDGHVSGARIAGEASIRLMRLHSGISLGVTFASACLRRGQLDEAVVGPSPDFILRYGRFDNSEDGVVVLRAGVVFVDGAAEICCLLLSLRVRSSLIASQCIPPSVV